MDRGKVSVVHKDVRICAEELQRYIRCALVPTWWALALLLLIAPRIAQAAPYLEIDGNFAGYENGETYNGYMVVDVSNEYQATLFLIGQYSSLPQIDQDMYVKLSNESTGGSFYSLVQEWEKVGEVDGGSSNYPGWAGNTYYQLGLVNMYGYGHVWECAVTDDMIDDARHDFLTVLEGGDLGGGSSSGGSGGLVADGDWSYIELSEELDPNENNTITNYLVNSITTSEYGYGLVNFGSRQGGVTWGNGTTFKCYIDAYTINKVNQYLTSKNLDPNDMQYLFCRSWGASYILCSTGDYEISRAGNGSYFYVKNNGDEPIRIISFDSNESKIGLYNNEQSCFITYGIQHFDFTVAPHSRNENYSFRPYWNSDGVLSAPSGGSGENNWPEDNPSVPDDDPVTLPPIGDPTIDDPDGGTWTLNFDLDAIVQRLDVIIQKIGDEISILRSIYFDMKNLDRSTNDLVDLSGVISAINNIRYPSLDLTSTNAILSDIQTAIGNISIPSPPDLSGIRSDLADIETAIGNISIPAAPNLMGIQTAVEDILDELQHAEYGTDMTQVEDLLSTNNARLGSIITAINDLDIPETDLTETVSAIDDVADACTDIYTDIHAYFAQMMSYWDGIDDTFVTFFTSWPDWVTDWSGEWSSLMTKLDQIYRRLGKKPWTGDVVGGPGVTLPDPGTDIVPIGDDDLDLPHFPWEALKPILQIPALEAAIMELMTKFPFVMLNELVTIGTYIQRTPTAPVFEVPAPNPSDWSHPHMVRIDLSQFDVAAAVLRAMIMIWACVRISNRTIKMWMGDKAVV